MKGDADESRDDLPEVWQAEWCPYSRKVRSALTELGITFVARQVSAEPEDRDKMEQAVGTREIPVVRFSDGTLLTGDGEDIVAALRSRYAESADAAKHRQKAREHAGPEG